MYSTASLPQTGATARLSLIHPDVTQTVTPHRLPTDYGVPEYTLRLSRAPAVFDRLSRPEASGLQPREDSHAPHSPVRSLRHTHCAWPVRLRGPCHVHATASESRRAQRTPAGYRRGCISLW